MRTLSHGAAGMDDWPIKVLIYRLAQFKKTHDAERKFQAALHGMRLK